MKGTEPMRSNASSNTLGVATQSMAQLERSNQETLTPLSKNLSEQLYSLLKAEAENRNVTNVVALAKELRELLRLNFEVKKWNANK